MVIVCVFIVARGYFGVLEDRVEFSMIAKLCHKNIVFIL